MKDETRYWDFEAGRLEPDLNWKTTRFLPPEVRLTDEDHQRIGVAKGLNSISRAYVMGLLAGMRRK
jgi:hypothetical protein